MTKSLLYLIKLSIVPVIALIGGKIVGIIIAGSLLGVEVAWNYSNPLSLLSPSVSSNDVISITTFANLFMYGCLAIGMSVVLIQSSFFHDSHIDINRVSKLADFNLIKLIKSSYDLYHWGFVWTIYLIIGTVLILLDTIVGKTAFVIFVITAVFSISTVMILVKDVYNEIEIAKQINKESNERPTKSN